ncbi:hypothetical protein BH10CYA1_BH10CYA1_36550 [soil metagenome]
MPSLLKILMLDNSSEFAATCGLLGTVTDIGFAMEQADSVSEATLKLSSSKYDAVLASMNLNDISGELAVASLRKHDPQMPIVVLGEDFDRALVKQVIEAGADNFLFRPISDGNRIAIGILYAQQQRAAIKRTRHNEAEAFLAHLQVGIEKKHSTVPLAINVALTDFVLGLESYRDFDYRASVLLLRDGHLYLGAAPNLPDAYNKSIEGVAIGSGVGSCGTAASSSQTVYVVDIETDTLWTKYKHLALPHGLKACWSVPIIDDYDVVLGTFALYYNQPRFPSEAEREFIHLAAKTAERLLTIFFDD